MKQRLFLFIFFVVFFATPSFSIAGTEGREFWVALTIGRGPKDASSGFEPKLCVSSKTRTGIVTVTNPQTGFTRSYPIPTGTGWLEITDIPSSEWYPFPASTGSQQSASGKTYKTGLKVTCTEDMSVFAALRYTNAFDASNILPITALQYDYIIQDYPPYANETPTTSFSNFCVLATENNTVVEITPSSKTFDSKAAGNTFTVTLNAGDVYYVVSESSTESNSDSPDAPQKSLSGSYVKSDKPVAVFNGDICTRVPNFKSARDINYEQAMPIDYWGREFVVTRSLEKDANRIRITAQEDDTDVNVNGKHLVTLKARQTYEIELAGGTMNQYDKQLVKPDAQFEGDALYIQTSCPCAVYNYDTGNSYTKSSNSEIESGRGDPSMTWMSPLDQNINEITFGVMNTDKTTYHFVNIVTQTDNINSIELREVSAGQYSNNMLSASDFTPVPSYPTYSYARKQLSIDRNTTYNLKGTTGFNAHVYGNGNNESYAYSVGSAAVKEGIRVGNNILIDEEIYDYTYCVNTPIEFDAQVTSSYTVDEVDWDFGDGVTELHSTNFQMTHTYESPGWYDVVCKVRAHKECPYGQYPDIEINTSIHVVEQKVIRQKGEHECIEPEDMEPGKTYPFYEEREEEIDCSTKTITPIEIGVNSYETIDLVGYDELEWYGQIYTQSGTYEHVIEGGNNMHCNHTITANIKIVACIDMDITLDKDSVCADKRQLTISYNLRKGELTEGKIWLELNDGKRVPLTLDENSKQIILDLRLIKPNTYDCYLVAYDDYCQREFTTPLHFVLQYASTSFNQKWDDVLVVTNETIDAYGIVGYQWLKNGEEIAGATSPWYYAPDYGEETTLDPEAEYSVRLTNKDNVTLESCSMQPRTNGDNSANIVSVAPTSLMPGESINVLTQGNATAEIYSTLGVRQHLATFEDTTTIQAPLNKGIYIIQITLENGTRVSRQLIVN